jgi:hypothetical protein
VTALAWLAAAVVPSVVISQPPPPPMFCFDQPPVRAYIRRHVDNIRYCYERELQGHPTLAGTVAVTFTIGTDGSVTHSGATGVDDEVSTCIAKVIAQIRFPPIHEPVLVHYPFELRPVVVREDAGEVRL